jgi:hypothetical protein
VNLKLLAANVRAQSGLAIIDLSGEIDSFAEQELNRAYDEAEAGDPRAIC